jgi:hypothetical protein
LGHAATEVLRVTRRKSGAHGESSMETSVVVMRVPAFQTRPHLPGRTDELLVSAMIRGLRGVDLVLCFQTWTDSDA